MIQDKTYPSFKGWMKVTKGSCQNKQQHSQKNDAESNKEKSKATSESDSSQNKKGVLVSVEKRVCLFSYVATSHVADRHCDGDQQQTTGIFLIFILLFTH
jgi:hypothetical protein